jgi:hypothetical protein
MYNYYNNSHANLLATVYPDYEWLPWKFNVTPKFFWKNRENCLKFLEWCKPILNIKYNEDWQRITPPVC